MSFVSRFLPEKRCWSENKRIIAAVALLCFLVSVFQVALELHCAKVRSHEEDAIEMVYRVMVIRPLSP